MIEHLYACTLVQALPFIALHRAQRSNGGQASITTARCNAVPAPVPRCARLHLHIALTGLRWRCLLLAYGALGGA